MKLPFHCYSTAWDSAVALFGPLGSKEHRLCVLSTGKACDIKSNRIFD